MAESKVFVGNVPPMDEATFRDFFTPYGSIVDLLLNKNKRFGFVSYSTPEEAQWAINDLEGVAVNDAGATFNLKLADKQGPPQPRQGPPAGNGFAPMQQNRFAPVQQSPQQGTRITKVFVGNVPPMDETSFRDFFVPYGTIVDLLLNTTKRFGFVSYSTQEEAQMAINGLEGVTVDDAGATFNLKFADKQGPPQPGQGFPAGNGFAAMQQNRFAPMQQSPQHGTTITKVFVGNVPPMDETSFRSFFAPYGTIVDLLLNTTKRFGFVSYSTQEEAQMAINELNGVVLNEEGATFNIKFADKQGPPGTSQPFPGQGKGGVMHVAPPVYSNGFARSDPYGKGAPAPLAFAHPKGNGKGRDQRDEFLLPNMQQTISQAESNSKLYVKGVPMHADDLFLYRVFAPFGAVLNAKCANKEMSDFAVGFVQYNTAAEAQAAIAGVSGETLTDGSVLEVSIKTQKGGKGK